MYYLNRILLGISFLIVIPFVSSCQKGQGNINNSSASESATVGFDREEELHALLTDLGIEISDETVLFMPPTHCEMCIKKASSGVDSLISRGVELRLVFAKSNHAVCESLELNDDSSCHFYEDSSIESRYGFYYWDPIVFAFKDGELSSYEIL